MRSGTVMHHVIALRSHTREKNTDVFHTSLRGL